MERIVGESYFDFVIERSLVRVQPLRPYGRRVAQRIEH